jgi:hypothetical protein
MCGAGEAVIIDLIAAAIDWLAWRGNLSENQEVDDALKQSTRFERFVWS